MMRKVHNNTLWDATDNVKISKQDQDILTLLLALAIEEEM
jgi:hypothetical protein